MSNVSSSNSHKELVPRLRFPQFHDEWSECELQNIFSKVTQKNSSGEIKNVICNSAQRGLIPQREYFEKDIANGDNTNGYFVIQKGDFVYNPRKSTSAPYGPVSVYNYDEYGIVSPLYLCFRPNSQINTAFYEWYFKSSAWHRYVYLFGDSGVRHDRVSIKDSVFFEMPLHIPSEQEQKQISNFLSILGKRIVKQQALVDSLKSYKRGLLHTFLDDICARVPLSEISEYYSSNNTMAIIEKHDAGAFSVYDASGKIAHIDGHDFDFDYVAIIKDGSGVGRLQLCEAQSSIIGTLGAIKPKGCSVDYLYAVLQNIDFRQFTTGMAIPHIYYKDYKCVLVPFPDKAAQNRIEMLFSKIDTVITHESALLDLLQLAKSSLLQQLFI